MSIGAVVLLVIRVTGTGFHDRIPDRLVDWTGDAFTTRSPSLPRYLFGMRDFIYANLAHLLIGAALMIGLVSIPLMSGTIYRLSAFESGVVADAYDASARRVRVRRRVNHATFRDAHSHRGGSTLLKRRIHHALWMATKCL